MQTCCLPPLPFSPSRPVVRAPRALFPGSRTFWLVDPVPKGPARQCVSTSEFSQIKLVSSRLMLPSVARPVHVASTFLRADRAAGPKQWGRLALTQPPVSGRAPGWVCREAERVSGGGRGLRLTDPALGAGEAVPTRECVPDPGLRVAHPVGRHVSDAHGPCVGLRVSQEGLLAFVCTAQGW